MNLPSPPQEAILGHIGNQRIPAAAMPAGYADAVSSCVQAGWIKCGLDGTYRRTPEGEAAFKQVLKEPIR